MRYKIVKQPDEMNCGVACLAMICAYYGIDKISLATIREFAQTDREGNSMFSLKCAAEKLHLNVNAYEAEEEDLLNEEIKLPAIIHTVVDGLYEHYMVLFEFNKNGAVLGDPAIGQIFMKREDLKNIWTGQIMTFEPTENFQENKKYKRDYKMVISLILKYKKYLIELFFISIIISGISIIAVKFYSYLVDNVIPDNNLQLLFQLLLITMGIYIFVVIINWIKLKITIKFNQKLDKELIINIYNRMTNLPMKFFSSRTSGDLASRFEDGDAIRTIITDFTLNFVIDSIFAIISLIAILIYHGWQIAVLTLIMSEIIILIQYFFKNKMIEQTSKSMRASTDVYSFANASFLGSETIKSYNAENTIESTMSKKYKNYQDVVYKNVKFVQIQNDLVSTIVEISNLFMLSVLGILVMNGQVSVGDMMFLYILIDYVTAPISYLCDMQDKIYETSASLERLDDVFKTTTEKEINQNRQNINDKIENIEFKDVTFQYGFRNPILQNISFDVKKGESIGIIGSSGSGKTTLIKLILNFYGATKGAIYINDKDINQITTSSLRRKIAYVSQNDFWFQDTIFNNLTIGNRSVSAEQVNKILEMVQMKEYVDQKPYGLNTMIEEGGNNFSTGQKQRLSLAKALLTNPDVLILDESTSNLDAKTEETIILKKYPYQISGGQKQRISIARALTKNLDILILDDSVSAVDTKTEETIINTLSKEQDKIKIIIAHRLNTLSKCDKIISIKDGSIVELGTPQELIKNKGMFFELWNTQNQAINIEKNNKKREN